MQSFEAITRENVAVIGGTLIQHGQNFRDGFVSGVDPNYFDVLGAQPRAGRFFLPDDETSGASVAVISEKLASALFPHGQVPIGQTITVKRRAYTVIGVASDRANFPHNETAVWTLARPEAWTPYSRILRLRDGATNADVARELALVAARIAGEAGLPRESVGFRLDQLANPDFQLRDLHVAMLIAVIAVLLIACANVANIQLARGIGRRRELALRSALGADRNRLVADLLIESGVLVFGGLMLGLLLTLWMNDAVSATLPSRVAQYVVEPQWSWRVLVASILVTVTALLLVGVAPALTVSRVDPNELLKSGNGTGATRQSRRRYSVLVSAEIALALALSAGAAVMIRAGTHTGDVHIGYDPHLLVGGSVVVSAERGTVSRQATQLADLVDRLRRIPGVTEAAATTGRNIRTNLVTYTDETGAREFPAPGYYYSIVSPGYFRTMRLPIVRGRDFLEGQQDEPVVIVDAHTARLLWPLSDPIGKRIKLGQRDTKLPYARVAGVVGEQPGYEVEVPPGTPVLNHLGRIYYLPGPTDSVVSDGVFSFSFVTRTEGNPTAQVLRTYNDVSQWPETIVARVRSLEDELLDRRRNAEFIAAIFTLFSLAGVGLAAFGVYGVVAYSVAERRREIGVRVALGASARDILKVVLHESFVVALAGIAVGLLFTKYGVMLFRDKAWGDDLYNAPLFAAIALLLLATSMLTAYFPAHRAARIEATESLRNE
jgi:putative ABC transport system permease protein